MANESMCGRRPRCKPRTRAEVWAAILAVCTLVPTCLCAPSFNPKPSWRDGDGGAPAILASSACNPATGRCWGWLPIVDSRLDDYALEQDLDFDREQAIHVRDVDQATDSWRTEMQAVGYAADAEAARSLLQQQQQQPTLMGNGGPAMAGRLAKKDVFMSRGWGAGGMPFSVLYMSPRANHPPSSGSAQMEAGKSGDSARRNGGGGGESSSPSTGRTNQSNYRVALRNGGFNQPRRHYSIIPQLFISYGWGPSGK